ncbi:hypothetical protein [Sphaerotilus mobilis]|uniref:Cytochrome c domain-containing protein n=1 Tax=Sphaerotilus mobilis TaxID=47994 RepID=A0A4Q7LIY0_9BURK|nr:hypothetical protein [Sphaerotilus mobilis]RZS54456.1 hypothetical protein EV685_1933 [Sphaerotilus mobilis]
MSPRRSSSRLALAPVLALVAMLLGASFLLGTATPLRAQGIEIFVDADLALGEKLIRESQCDACHARNVGGDGHDIYNPKGRISTPGALRGMVEYCNTELGLGFFPEEVTAIAAVLQRDHYRFR